VPCLPSRNLSSMLVRRRNQASRATMSGPSSAEMKVGDERARPGVVGLTVQRERELPGGDGPAAPGPRVGADLLGGDLHAAHHAVAALGPAGGGVVAGPRPARRACPGRRTTRPRRSRPAPAIRPSRALPTSARTRSNPVRQSCPASSPAAIPISSLGRVGQPGGDREHGALQGGEGGFAEAVPGQGGDRPAHVDGHRGQGQPGGRGTRRAAKRCGGSTGPEVPSRAGAPAVRP